MRGSEFDIDYVQLLYFKCHKINLSRGESNIDSSYWMKTKNNNKSYQ